MTKIKTLVELTIKEHLRKAEDCKYYKEANLQWSKESGNSKVCIETYLVMVNEYEEEELKHRRKAKELKDELDGLGL